MNSVISAATIEARNSGWDVLGIMDRFEHLIEGRTGEVRPRSITDVSRIHAQGESIIRPSRANPPVRPADLRLRDRVPRDEPVRLSRLVDVVETTMLKRIAHGRPFGVVVLAEGLGLRLPARQVKDRFRARGRSVTVEGKNIGYELRCAPLIPSDIESSSYRVAREP